jgi:hypothetical protein
LALLYFVVFFSLAMDAVDTCWVSQKNKRRARAIEKSEMHAGANISSFEMPCPLSGGQIQLDNMPSKYTVQILPTS